MEAKRAAFVKKLELWMTQEVKRESVKEKLWNEESQISRMQSSKCVRYMDSGGRASRDTDNVT